MAGSSNYGFGAPDDGTPDADGYFALGFGDPDDGTWQDGANGIGFGDPEIPDAGQMNLLPAGATPRWEPDDGGDVITLQGDFAATGAKLFRVKLYNHATGEAWPKTGFGCEAVVPNTVDQQLPAELDGQRLRFSLPMLPPAVYDAQVFYGPGYAAAMPLFEAAFQVINRHWGIEEHSIRDRMPSVFTAVVRDIGEEPMLGGV